MGLGIEKLKLSEKLQSEDVQSPMKIRKQTLASVQTTQFQLNPQNIIKEQNQALIVQLKQLERNFDAKQSLFSNLQKLPDSELEKLYNTGELKNLKQKWQTELEVKFEPANEEENAQLVDFNL